MRKRLFSLLLAAACVCGILTAAAPEARAWASVEDFKAYALANWSRPLRAEYKPLVGLACFGASRNSRRHAAVDLVVDGGAGTPVYAMADGVVMEYCPDFYCGTSSIGVENADGSVLRYCEISTYLTNGDTVQQGQVIGWLIPNYDTNECMLHLELYLGTRTGGLTDTGNYRYDYISNAYYARRADLLDPTFLLWITRFTGEHEHVWNDEGFCAVCERHWSQFEDTSRHAATFLDVTVDDYCYDAVLWGIWTGAASGASAAFFRPEAKCTRAQAVTYLWRAMGSPASWMGWNPFSDLSEYDECYEAARWAYAMGVTAGVGDGLFGPNEGMTRAQVLLLLWRAAGAPEQDVTLWFEDVPEWSDYSEAIEWAVANGIAGGLGPATFGPAEMCTRGQLITFLYRAYGWG